MSKFLTSHRSLGLLNNKSYSLTFLNYLDRKDSRFEDYINFLKKNNVRKVFIFDGFATHRIEDCLNNKLKTKEKTQISFGRNPFKEKIKRESYIYDLDLENLSTCIK